MSLKLHIYHFKFLSKQAIQRLVIHIKWLAIWRMKQRYRDKVGRRLQLKEPRYYNDKLQWLKLNDPMTQYRRLADKVEVRDYVRQRIGDGYLNHVYFITSDPKSIQIEQLPDRFVIKASHTSGHHIVCPDKSRIKWSHTQKVLSHWMKIDYYVNQFEPVYKDLVPRIICEKYLEQDGYSELLDYRVFCFHGKAKFVAVDLSITDKSRVRRNIYDLSWNRLPVRISYPNEENIIIAKPSKLEEMIEMSERLAIGIPHVRVDWYQIHDKLIFGEMTFFHQGGRGQIIPESFEEEMGSWLAIPS